MPIDAIALPYARTALEPHLSGATVDSHHGQIQQQYLEQLNARIANTALADVPLEQIVRRAQGSVFELAAQVWNHDFYWRGLRARGGGEPTGALAAKLAQTFGDFTQFREAFQQAALNLPGPGWTWLVQRADGTLAVLTTTLAATPLTGSDIPLLACDLWEHAYWLDHHDDRERYLETFWKLVNWDAVAARLR